MVILIQYAAAFVACKAADWPFDNGDSVGLVDMSERDGSIPGTSIGKPGHPVVPLKIAFSGCSNDCGHAQAADIGLQGNQVKDMDSYVDFFDIIVGTKVGESPSRGVKIRTRIPANEVADEIGALIRSFNEHRHPSESFPDFSRRYFTEEGIEFQI